MTNVAACERFFCPEVNVLWLSLFHKLSVSLRQIPTLKSNIICTLEGAVWYKTPPGLHSHLFWSLFYWKNVFNSSNRKKTAPCESLDVLIVFSCSQVIPGSPAGQIFESGLQMVSHIICCFKRYSVAKTDLADPSQVPCDLSRDIYVLACPRVMAAATWRVDRSTKQACVHFLLLTSSAQFIINLLLNRLLNQTVVTSSKDSFLIGSHMVHYWLVRSIFWSDALKPQISSSAVLRCMGT